MLFFLGSICIALYCTAATIIRQIIGTYTAAAKYLFPAIGYAVAAMTVICGLFIIQSHMTGAFVTGHVVCGLGFITACVSTAATSSTRFSLIPKNSGDSTFSVNPAGFTRGQSSLLIFIVSAIAAGAWVWCTLLFPLGQLPVKFFIPYLTHDGCIAGFIHGKDFAAFGTFDLVHSRTSW